jgi:hypothetical protein
MTATIELRERYRTRSIRSLGLWEPGGWRLKVYGIAYEGDTPREGLVEAVKRRAMEVLPAQPTGDGRYGVGFIGAHDGRAGCFGFLDWWADENELHHRAFNGPWDSPDAIAPVKSDGSIACAWDIAVIAFERQAWVDTVLANPRGPSLETYLGQRMNAAV